MSNRCSVCGDILGSEPKESLNNGELVHRKCFLFQYQYLKSLGLVGKKDEQRTLKC